MSNEKVLFEDKVYKITTIPNDSCLINIYDKENEAFINGDTAPLVDRAVRLVLTQLQTQNAQLTQQISNNYLTIESKQCVIESLTDERAELEGEIEQLTQKLEGAREALLGILLMTATMRML